VIDFFYFHATRKYILWMDNLNLNSDSESFFPYLWYYL